MTLSAGIKLFMLRPSAFMEKAAAPSLEQLSRLEGVHRVGIHMRIGGDQWEDPARQPLECARF